MISWAHCQPTNQMAIEKRQNRRDSLGQIRLFSCLYFTNLVPCPSFSLWRHNFGIYFVSSRMSSWEVQRSCISWSFGKTILFAMIGNQQESWRIAFQWSLTYKAKVKQSKDGHWKFSGGKASTWANSILIKCHGNPDFQTKDHASWYITEI